MSYLSLAMALILPWATGYVWLRYFESFFARSADENRFRVLGYAFFFGYAWLSVMVILNSKLTGTVSYAAVILILAILSAAGAVLLRRRIRSGHDIRATSASPSPGGKFGPAQYAGLLLGIWLLLHLSLSLLEILMRPVYPWDAWLMWIYRAKAWFYMGGVVDFQNSIDWLGSSAPAYTSNALDYPLFASVIPLWAALGLGHWSETLINLPVILCGIAIALALYGQCRESGLSAPMAVVVCYLLLSTPFFGTHLALAGYADIWMCGFTGLGFMALIQGGISNKPKQSVIGLILVALSILVKNEGLVWFLGAVLFLLFLYAPRKLLLVALAAAAGLILLALNFGIEPINIPWIGQLSVVGQQVTLPFVGTFTLQVFNVWQQYLVSFVLTGSWNLTWILLASCLVLYAASAKEKTNSVGATFILIFLATQIVIFVFSSHGEFAMRYTAINRLPLHFLPAILFTAAVMVHNRLTFAPAATAQPVSGTSDGA